MPDIYSLAIGVAVWLGPESDDSVLAMKALGTVGSKIEVNWTFKTMVSASKDNIDLESAQSSENLRLGHKTWSSIHDLLNRPWFKRLWIWQEVSLAKNPINLVCGRESVLWADFGSAIFYPRFRGVHNISNLPQLLDQAYRICKQGTRSYLSSIVKILEETKNSECSDERDRIYAVLNIVRKIEGSAIEPDYSKPVQKVFQEFVLRDLKVNGRLHFLAYCHLRERVAKKPTWVPDWSIPTETKMIDFSGASRNTRARAYYAGNGVLVAVGVLQTTARTVEELFPKSQSSNNAQLAQVIRNLVRAKSNFESSEKIHRSVDAICRTLCADEFCERCLPINDNGPNFQEAKDYVHSVSKDSSENPMRLPQPPAKYFNEVWEATRGRSFLTTEDGLTGLVPKATRLGDQICALLGCQSLLILRPNEADYHSVVGECYLDGFIKGEAFLGPLPSNWKYLRRWFPELKRIYRTFLNRDTGETTPNDPGLGPLPAGWRIRSHKKEAAYNRYVNDATGEDTYRFDPMMEPEALRERGVNLQEFRLI